MKSIYDWYYQHDMFLVPLAGRAKKHKYKYPTLRKRREQGKLNVQYMRNMADTGNNIGILIGTDSPEMEIDGKSIAPIGRHVILDVDMHAEKAGYDSLARLQKAIDVEFEGKYPEVDTGNGGRHIIMKLSGARRNLAKKLTQFPEIELLSSGLAVAVGSVHPDTGMIYDWRFGYEWPGEIPDAPEELLNLYDTGEAPRIKRSDVATDGPSAPFFDLALETGYAPLFEDDRWAGAITGEDDRTWFLDPPYRSSKSKKSLHISKVNGLWYDQATGEGGGPVHLIERDEHGLVTRGSMSDTLAAACDKYSQLAGISTLADTIAAPALELIKGVSVASETDETDESYGHLLSWCRKKLVNDDNNVILFLQRHPDFRGKLGYNTRSANCCLMGPSPFDLDEKTQYPKTLHPSDILRVVTWFASEQKLSVSREKIEKLIRPICMDPYRSIQFDPFEDYLNSLKWDGTSRLDTFLIDAARVEDSAYMRDVSAKTLISAVARTYEPGCKVDTMPILVGPQGIGKSTLIRTLLPDPEYFSDHLPTLADKDAKAQIHGLVFLELGELDAFSRSDTTAIKNFVTVQVDRFRPPYGRAPENFPRTCIFIGTTNADDFLKDVTGARRFWPIEIEGHIDLESVARDRDQLWAEAVVRYNTGERWWLSGDALTGQVDAAEKHREIGSYETKISSYLEKRAGEVDESNTLICGKHPMYENGKRVRITMNEILDSALMIPIDRQNRGTTTEVGRAMRALGWKKIRARGSKSELMHFYESPDLQRK